ncbi:putative Kaptin [Hypsibius exemplaris]|uniref:Kaptin n=1 Tax=Hypsibius exemplaris TaxID=2072580 RepID=A0A1W0WU84_HYPEX|nr:putative Kaptin [Hypsibius exemplaris]
MPVGVRRTISEVDEGVGGDVNDERDVHFFLPNSRRQSEEESAASPHRPRAFAMSQENLAGFMLVHTFQLPSQTGPSQVILLPATKTTGVRILAACRDDSFRYFYFHLGESDSGDEICVTPKARMISSLLIEKDWKVGALSLVPRQLEVPNAPDVVAYILYRTIPKEQVVENESSQTSWLSVAVFNGLDDSESDGGRSESTENSADGDAGHLATACGGKMPFLPHGCNQLIWWKPLGAKPDANVSVLIPGQDEGLYSVAISLEQIASHTLTFADAFTVIPELKNLSASTCINALDYLDILSADGSPQRIVVLSHKARSEIVVGQLNCITQAWTLLWTCQHDSMTSRMRLFRSGDVVDLLVVGLCEPVVVFRNIVTSKRPKATVLPDSNRFDMVTCCDVADVDGDGQLEVILGTYGRTVLVYKLYDDKDPTLLHRVETAFPVHFVAFAPLTGADTSELLVITQKGVHVYSLL